MYLKHFGFKIKPFLMTPNTSFLYLGETHKLALDLFEYGLTEQTGFIIITGEIGSGKTLLIRQVMKNADTDFVIGLISNTHPHFGDMMRWVASAFDLYRRDKDKIELYEDFLAYLVEQRVSGRRTALIIDEAQNLDLASLEELRMLSNVNCEDDYLLQIILVGQPDLVQKLQDPSLVQLAQRIGVHFHLEPLNCRETENYIRHRLQVAGGDPEIFNKEACAGVYYFTKGIPRLINIMCDLSLVVSYAHNRTTVGLDSVIGVAAQRNKAGLVTSGSDSESIKDARRAILRLCALQRLADFTA